MFRSLGRRRLILIFSLPLLVGALGCGKARELAKENEILKKQRTEYRKTIVGLQAQIDSLNTQLVAPTWTKMASWVELNSKGKVFYGVGIAQGIRNGALAIMAADSRSRAEIAKLMAVETEQFGTMTRSLVQKTLHGVEIIEHWKDPEDGTQFTLAKVALKPPRR